MLNTYAFNSYSWTTVMAYYSAVVMKSPYLYGFSMASNRNKT